MTPTDSARGFERVQSSHDAPSGIRWFYRPRHGLSVVTMLQISENAILSLPAESWAGGLDRVLRSSPLPVPPFRRLAQSNRRRCRWHMSFHESEEQSRETCSESASAPGATVDSARSLLATVATTMGCVVEPPSEERPWHGIDRRRNAHGMVSIGERLQRQEPAFAQQVIQGMSSDIAGKSRACDMQRQPVAAGFRDAMMRSHFALEQQDAHEFHGTHRMMVGQEQQQGMPVRQEAAEALHLREEVSQNEIHEMFCEEGAKCAKALEETTQSHDDEGRRRTSSDEASRAGVADDDASIRMGIGEELKQAFSMAVRASEELQALWGSIAKYSLGYSSVGEKLIVE